MPNVPRVRCCRISSLWLVNRVVEAYKMCQVSQTPVPKRAYFLLAVRLAMFVLRLTAHRMRARYTLDEVHP